MGLYDSPIRPSTQTLCLLGLRWNEPEALNPKPLNMLYHMSLNLNGFVGIRDFYEAP